MQPSEQATTARWRRLVWGGGLILLATLVAYWPALGAGFVWDDDTHITENEALRTLGGLWAIWCQPGATCQYYPLTFTVWWVGYHLWGLNPVGYHVLNVLLHGGVAVLLWQVLAKLRVKGAWLAGALFALHPVNVMSVAWVTELKNTLSGGLALGAMWAYLRYAGVVRSETWPVTGGGMTAGANVSNPVSRHSSLYYYGLALGMFALAMLAKTAVSFVPVTLLLVVWWRGGRLGWREVRPLLPLVGLAVVLGQVTFWVERYRGAAGTAFDLGLLERVLVSGRSFWYYLGKFVFPYPLTFIYERWVVDREVLWQYAYPVALVCVLWGLWRWRGRLGKGLVVAVVHYYVATSLLILLTVLYMTQFSWVSDHWQYYGSMSMAAVVAGGMVWALEYINRGWRCLKPAVWGLVLLGLGILTWRQCGMYADVETLWQTTLARNPTCWLAHNNLGLVLLEVGKTVKAISHFEEALAVQPYRTQARNNLGTALLKAGRLSEAKAQYEQVLGMDPRDADAHSNLGAVLLKEGRVAEAEVHFAEALRLRPKWSEPHYNWGRALLIQKRWAEAQGHLEAAVALKPGDADARMDLGVALYKQGRVEEGRGQFDAAVRLKGEYGEGRRQMEGALAAERQARETIKQLGEVLAVRPGDVAARRQMAETLYALGEVGEAVKQYEAVLREKGEAWEVCNQLAWILATSGEASIRDGGRAVELGERALALVEGGEGKTNVVWGVLDTLGAGYAAAGRYREAVVVAERAVALAKGAGQMEAARRIEERLKLYQANQPYREGGPGTP